MKQAESKVSSDDGIKRPPSLGGFRLTGTSSFGPATPGPDGVNVSLYSVNPGFSVEDALMEAGYLADVIAGLTRSIAERVEGDDSVAAQLAYAAWRMAEQASALASSALTAEGGQS